MDGVEPGMSTTLDMYASPLAYSVATECDTVVLSSTSTINLAHDNPAHPQRCAPSIELGRSRHHGCGKSLLITASLRIPSRGAAAEA